MTDVDMVRDEVCRLVEGAKPYSYDSLSPSSACLLNILTVRPPGSRGPSGTIHFHNDRAELFGASYAGEVKYSDPKFFEKVVDIAKGL